MFVQITLKAENVRKLKLLKDRLAGRAESFENEGLFTDATQMRIIMHGLEHLTANPVSSGSDLTFSQKGFRSKNSAAYFIHDFLVAFEDVRREHPGNAYLALRTEAVKLAEAEGQGLEYFADVIAEIASKAADLKISLTPVRSPKR